MNGNKNIGLLFGSFNPVHVGHLILANYMKEIEELDEVWFMVSPLNPFKKSADLIDEQLRLQMVNIALEGQSEIKSCDIEFQMPIPSFTIDTLIKLKGIYQDYNFSLIMGTDNVIAIDKWKDGQQILDQFKVYIYPRVGYEVKKNNYHKNIKYTKAPIIEISSTYIRNSIAQGKKMTFFMPKGVAEFISQKKLYQ